MTLLITLTICCRCASVVHEAAGPVHPAPVDHVSGERGPPAGHGQLLHQLPHLLLSLQAVQDGPLHCLRPLLPQTLALALVKSPGSTIGDSTLPDP